MLSAERVFAALPERLQHSLPKPLVLASVDSTHAMLLGQARSKKHITCQICLAEYQTAGRGRRGSCWVMPAGSGIALSLLWPVDASSALAPTLSLAFGVVIAEALERLAPSPTAHIGLKWPNDLLVEGQKLGGLISEAVFCGGQPRALVVSVGLNVCLPADAPIDQAWTDLVRTGLQPPKPSRSVIAAVLITALVDVLDTYPAHGFAAYAPRWQARDVSHGRAVSFIQAGQTMQGIAQGLDLEGNLRVLCQGQTYTLRSAECSLRIATDTPSRR